jgi:hypothetical protein
MAATEGALVARMQSLTSSRSHDHSVFGWFEIQRRYLESIFDAHRTRAAALQNIRSAPEWVATERTFLSRLNDTALDHLKANIDWVRDTANRALAGR